jgi:hypothetical protein
MVSFVAQLLQSVDFPLELPVLNLSRRFKLQERQGPIAEWGKAGVKLLGSHSVNHMRTKREQRHRPELERREVGWSGRVLCFCEIVVYLNIVRELDGTSTESLIARFSVCASQAAKFMLEEWFNAGSVEGSTELFLLEMSCKRRSCTNLI